MATIADEIKRLADEQKRAWENEGKPLADAATTRGLTVDEREKFERLEGVYNDYDERLLVLTRQRDLEERAANFAGELLGNRSAFGNAADLKAFADELRSVLRGSGAVDYVPDAAEVRALSAGIAAAGGNTIGKTFLAQLVEPLRMFSGVFAAGAYTFTTESGEPVALPRLTGFGTAVGVNEATQIGGTDPTFGQVNFNAYKYGQYQGVSRELVDDSLVDIEGLVTRIMGENISVQFGAKLATGTGTNEPMGLLTAATVGVTGSAGQAGAPTWDNLIDLQESVLAPYHARAAWVASNSAVASVRKLKDQQGRYLWEPNGQTGAPSTLLGAPLHRDPFFANVAPGAKSISFGDHSRYWVRLVGSVRTERSDHALFGSDQVAFRSTLRADGQLVDASAVKTFVGGAA